MKIAAIFGLLAAGTVVALGQDPYADSVVSYVPGTGINSSFETSTAALGAPVSGSDGSTPYSIAYPAYKNTQVVGVGENGELTLEFNTPITNDPGGHADGMDFTIFGNDFFSLGSGGTIAGEYDHPGLSVWVSQDDSTFYELTPPNGYGADDSFPTQGNGDPSLPVNPSLTPSDLTGLTEGQALSLYNGSAGGASYSLSWAVNGNGAPVVLPSISYIEIAGGTSSGFGYVDAVARVAAIPEPEGVEGLAAAFGGLALIFGMRQRLRKHGFGFAAAAASFLALAGIGRADTSDASYLLFQGSFGDFEWQYHYEASTPETGQDLLNAVFGTPVLSSSTYTDGFGSTYSYYTAGNAAQGAGYIDFGGGSLFLVSVTLDSTTIAQDPSYSPGWNYYVAGGGSNYDTGYDPTTWSYSNDGLDTRSLADGSFDAWVFGSTDNPPAVSGSNSTPTAANFAGAPVVGVIPEPGSGTFLLIAMAGGVAFQILRRRRCHSIV